jgi:streptomycin 6-kinase
MKRNRTLCASVSRMALEAEERSGIPIMRFEREGRGVVRVYRMTVSVGVCERGREFEWSVCAVEERILRWGDG